MKGKRKKVWEEGRQVLCASRSRTPSPQLFFFCCTHLGGARWENAGCRPPGKTVLAPLPLHWPAEPVLSTLISPALVPRRLMAKAVSFHQTPPPKKNCMARQRVPRAWTDESLRNQAGKRQAADILQWTEYQSFC